MFLGDPTQRSVSFSFTIELIDINDHDPELAMDDTNLFVYENLLKV